MEAPLPPITERAGPAHRDAAPISTISAMARMRLTTEATPPAAASAKRELAPGP